MRQMEIVEVSYLEHLLLLSGIVSKVVMHLDVVLFMHVQSLLL
jgi:hypothetical protein